MQEWTHIGGRVETVYAYGGEGEGYGFLYVLFCFLFFSVSWMIPHRKAAVEGEGMVYLHNHVFHALSQFIVVVGGSSGGRGGG